MAENLRWCGIPHPTRRPWPNGDQSGRRRRSAVVPTPDGPYLVVVAGGVARPRVLFPRPQGTGRPRRTRQTKRLPTVSEGWSPPRWQFSSGRCRADRRRTAAVALERTVQEVADEATVVFMRGRRRGVQRRAARVHPGVTRPRAQPRTALPAALLQGAESRGLEPVAIPKGDLGNRGEPAPASPRTKLRTGQSSCAVTRTAVGGGSEVGGARGVDRTRTIVLTAVARALVRSTMGRIERCANHALVHAEALSLR